MKRILGAVVAIAALLAFSTAAEAATVVFDVSGDIGTYSKSTDANAAIPGPPENGGPCPDNMVTPEAGGCFRYPFLAGSSLTVDITGTDVTMLGGTLLVNAVTPLVFGTIVLTTNSVTTVDAGATGTLVGDDILWSTPSSYSVTGTIQCDGPNCALVSLPEATPLPIQPILSSLRNDTSVTAFNWGTWALNGAHDDIVGSTLVITSWSNVIEAPDRRVSAMAFGSTVIPVPEPGSAALVLLGLGALALRSRKA